MQSLGWRVCTCEAVGHPKTMEKISHTSTTGVQVVVEYDSTIAGPTCLGDAIEALGRIAAELLLDLKTSEVASVAV